MSLYNSAKVKLVNGSIDLDTDTIKVALCTSSYTPNIDSHDFFNDVTNELAATGNYSAGGFTLASKTVTQDDVNDRAVFDAADISQASFTGTYRTLVIYKSTGTAATSPLIAYYTFPTDRILTAETLYIQWDTTGIILFT